MEDNRKGQNQNGQPDLREPLTTIRGIREIVEVEKRNREARSRLDLFAAAVTNFAGSASAILIHAIWFVLWILINVHAIPGIAALDPGGSKHL